MSEEDRPLHHPDLTSREERDRAIAEVLADQEVKKVIYGRPTTPRTTTVGRVVAMVLLTLTAVYLWFARPGWIVPDPPPPLPAERIETHLRMAVWMQAQQVERFRRERGRLPDALRETGEPMPAMTYRRIDARTFHLLASGDGVTVEYLSTDSLGAFVGAPDLALGLRAPDGATSAGTERVEAGEGPAGDGPTTPDGGSGEGEEGS